ncbi:hypothetical protein [Tersicoccus sp. Bi-70]|uniref:hypothetical protein n=1 Tax=Tersicoccus sp. Bi-70 TaxID=1897634 RepID=UPI00097641E1|nr:hypothetical protein [Tersicoccus sp. Bi-70]OMH31285.1 hypothetical protein BGP79_09655 [Tersicoccus sp. Bi-70]
MQDFETPTPDERTTAHRNSRRTRSTVRWAATGLLTLGLAGAGGVAVMAAGNGTDGQPTSGATPSPSASASPGQHHGHGRGHRGDWFPVGPARAPLHGEFVVPKGQSTATVLVQRGQITAVSSTSVTVKSSDGYTATYALGTSSKLFAAPTRPLRTPDSSAGPDSTPSPSASPSAGAQARGTHGARHRTTITASELKVGDRVALMAAKSGTPTVERLLVLPAGAGRTAPATPAPSSGATTPAPTSSS